MHLRYDLMDAHASGEARHPQDVIAALGIAYQHATPQSITDEWWFWNCENVPSVLPSYIVPLDVDPMAVIGYGLSEETARLIALGEKEENQ